MTPRRSYEVVVSGRVSGVVAESLAPLTTRRRNGATTISGAVIDAAMLAGVLRMIERLGLELIAVSSSAAGEPERRWAVGPPNHPRRVRRAHLCAPHDREP